MQIYVHRNGQQLGPFTDEEVRAQLTAGAISLQDNVWWQGLANWMPLGQSPLIAGAASVSPGITTAVPSQIGGTPGVAIGALVCGILGLLCTPLSIVAVILGHLSLSHLKKNPGLPGRGVALAGLITGYVGFALLIISITAMLVLMAFGQKVGTIFDQINAQAQSAQTQTPDDTSSDSSTNSADQNSTTNSDDSSTNSAPSITP